MSATRMHLARAIGTRLARSRRPVVIWGAGAGGRQAAAALTGDGVSVTAFVDRDPGKAGTMVEGRPVLTPAALAAARPRPRVVVASMHWREIVADLRARGFRRHGDIAVFPLEGVHDVPGASADPRPDVDYGRWRDQWRESQDLAAPGRGPRVVAIAWPATRREDVAARLRHLADERWVLLHDARVAVSRWRWRRPALDRGGEAGAADYDWAVRSRRGPFLLAQLIAAAAIAPPVVCRAGTLRAVAARRASLLEITAALAERAVRPPAGTCEARLIRRPRGPRGLPIRDGRPPAPGLIAFAADRAASGRPVFLPGETADVLLTWSRQVVDGTPALEYLRARRRPAAGIARLQVLAHSRGNFFFREIRDFLARGWRRQGIAVQIGDERTTPCPDARAVVVAPHEFFAPGGPASPWSARRDVVLVNTEQPQTAWFAACLPRLLTAPLVFDLNWQTALLLRAIGVAAHFLPLGYDAGDPAARPRRRLPSLPAFAGISAGVRRLPSGAAWRDRPIDVLFVGTLSPRRARALAAAAHVLADHRCFLHLPSSSQPLVADSVDALDARAMADLCRRAKIVLNVHRDDVPYFEWHRVVYHAIRQGALVVSEPMMPVPSLVPGVHYVEAPLARLPQTLRHLLGSASGRRAAGRVAGRGRAALARRYRAATIARRSLALL